MHLVHFGQDRINHSGGHRPTNVSRGPFLVCVARIFSGGALSPKSWRPFLLVVVLRLSLHWTFKRQAAC